MRDLEKEAVQETRCRRIGEFIESLGGANGCGGLEGGVLTGLTVRLPTEEDPSTLLVVKARGEAGAFVAFVGAYRLGDAVLAWRKRCIGGMVKWREDVPWSERS